MRVRIKDDVCQGHAMCALVCPQMFELEGDAGHAQVIAELVPENLEKAVQRAKLSCPEQAIEIF